MGQAVLAVIWTHSQGGLAMRQRQLGFLCLKGDHCYVVIGVRVCRLSMKDGTIKLLRLSESARAMVIYR
jgi:hypothetical protein